MKKYVLLILVLLQFCYAGEVLQPRIIIPPNSPTLKNETRGGETLEEVIAENLYALNTQIDVSSFKMGEDDFLEYYWYFFHNNPQFFFVYSSIDYAYNSKGIILNFTPEYLVSSQAELTEMTQEFNLAAARALRAVNNDMNDLGKALALHDFILLNCGYDDNIHSPYSHTAYGALVEELAVCEGYTKAYNLLLSNYLDVETSYVISEKMNHSWSAVKIDGKFYHADITWDDSYWDQPGSVSYENFLLNDAGISSTGHYSWVSRVTIAANEPQNPFWKESVSPIIQRKGDAYFMKNDSKLYKHNFETGLSSVVASLDEDDIWYVWGSENTSYYPGCYSSLANLADLIVFHGPSKVYAYDINTKITKTIYEVDPEKEEGYLYGIWNDSDGSYGFKFSEAPHGIFWGAFVSWISPETISMDDVLITMDDESQILEISVTPENASYFFLDITVSDPALGNVVFEDDNYKFIPLAVGKGKINLYLGDTGYSTSVNLEVLGKTEVWSTELAPGWNLIAPPLSMNDASAALLKALQPYSFSSESRVYTATSIKPWQPVWIYNKGPAREISLTGNPIAGMYEPENAPAGWSTVVPAQDTPLPENTTAWEWNGTIFKPVQTTLKAGKPYFLQK